MKLWSGRFTKPTEGIVDEFSASIPFDKRLYREDIEGSIAYARMLGECGVIRRDESDKLIEGLKAVLGDIEAGVVDLSLDAEDIHTNIERLLEARVGEVARKLHTGRSRNDQVATDTRLYVRREIASITGLIRSLQWTLVDIAEKNLDCIMPGYTHLQRAQPVLLSHHLMAYFEMLERDVGRFRDCSRRANILPLGSGALAGTTFPVDRKLLASMLGFNDITRNSIDAVSDRDFVIEVLSACSITMMHLSRLSEEIVLWSSSEFAYIELDDAYATGSSIMPQKKNPDIAELIRGKTGRVYGDLVSILVVMKGLPLAYNKDMQEDKEALFDGIDTLKACLSIVQPMLRSVKINKERLMQATRAGFMTATDVADYLARKGVPFRSAHEIVGRIVLYCTKEGKTLEELSMEEWKSFSGLFDEDIKGVVSVEASVAARSVPGGTARERVVEAIARARQALSEAR
ncbi:MAG TPA: argininosuccinate lyase [Firmicutes bacterium]|nr:argininosuccinate lyase [Bacillota bacterium]